MKRFLALIFAIVMVISCVACSPSLSESVTGETETAEEKKTAGNKKEETKEDKIVYPEGFSAGYARVDITPDVPLAIYDGTAETAADALMLTCIAVCDGENVGLLMTIDLKSIQRSVAEASFKTIERKFGIPEANIVISATHTHSAHTAGGSSAEMTRWLSSYYKQLALCVEEALRDLAPAEAYVGTAQAPKINFVRRYLLSNGKYQTNPSADGGAVAHESEADRELRTIRFERGDEKDIVMMNFQTHYGLYVEQYSADFVHYLRTWAEKETDAHFAYYSGASGNLNMTTRLAGESASGGDKMKSVEMMWETAKEAMKSEEKVNVGKVVANSNLYDAKVHQDSEEDIRRAKEIDALAEDNPKRTELMAKYGISSSRWVQGVVTRSGLGETQKIPFHAISFGDIAFTSSPIEQFDANAKQARDASPFKMTFTLSLTNGSYGYVPTKEAFPHGSYEVLVCRYAEGSGEEFAQEQIRLLNLCYNAQ